MSWQVLVYLSKYLIFLQISELTSNNSPQLPKTTTDTRKIQNKLTTVGSGKKNLQTCYVAKFKAAT